MKKFDYSLDFKTINFRDNPELYIVGKGEQGVLLVEPYKSELLPHWRFKTPEIAEISSSKLYEMYLDYKQQGDFVGMDMARKFIQMGYTRARRYANHPGGRKYDKESKELIPIAEIEPVKAESARIFKLKWDAIRSDETYQQMKQEHRQKYES